MFELITISEAMRYVREGTGTLVDVRLENAYMEGHLPGAVNVPLSEILSGSYRFDSGKRILLYCDTGSGSLMAARRLDLRGYSAYSISGGISSFRGRLETG